MCVLRGRSGGLAHSCGTDTKAAPSVAVFDGWESEASEHGLHWDCPAHRRRTHGAIRRQLY